MKALYLYIFLFSLTHCYCLQSVKVQLKWYHQFQFAGIYQAKEQGYYKDAGLDVDILEINRNITSVSQVLDGNAEFGVGSVDVLYSYLSGYDVQLIATIFQENPLVLASLQLDKFKDLKNFNYSKLMLNAQKFDSLPIYMMLEKMGININSIQSVPFDYSRIVNKNLENVDGFIIYATDQFKYNTLFQDKIKFFRPIDFDVSIYGDVLFTSKDYAEKYPDKTLGFKKATLKGWSYALANSMETIELIKSRYKSSMSNKELFLEYKATKKMVEKNLVSIGFSNKKLWEQMATKLSDLNLLPHKRRDLKEFYFSHEENHMSYHRSLLLIFVLLTLIFCIVQFYKWFRPQVRTRKELESDLLKAKDHLLSIQEFASIGTWSYLVGVDKFYFSKGLDYLLKKDGRLSQPKYSDFLSFIHEDDKDLFDLYFNNLCNQGSPFDLTFRVKREDGELRDFIINGYTVLKEKKEVLQVQGEVKDVTEYMEQEQKLRLTKFSVDDSKELMIWLDLEGKIFDLNNSVCQTFNIIKEDLIGRVLSDVYKLVSYEDLQRDILTIRDTGELRTEIEFTVNNEQTIPYEIIGSCVSFKKDEYIFLSLRDISEQKSYESELILAKKEAEIEEQLKSNLLATMSHEFHTPINAIVGFSSMLKESSSDERPVYVEEIDKSSQRLQKLLEDTLLFSSISQDEVSFEEFSIKDVVEIACMEVQESIQNMPITLKCNINENVPNIVSIDSKLFASLLKNLLENAIKYSNEGTVNINLDYSESLKDFSWPYLILIVEDQGIGIEECYLEKIFSPFYQVDSSHKRIQAGTGMGLAVCKKVMDCVGGTIHIDSKLYKGTKFTVKFPLISS